MIRITFSCLGGLLIIVSWGTVVRVAAESPPTCANAAVKLTHDYTYVTGTADFFDPDGDSESGSTFRWLVNGTPSTAKEVAEQLLLHFDGSPDGIDGEIPDLAQGVNYTTGRWGSALMLEPGSSLRFGQEGNLDLTQGTIEMWVAMRADGDDPVYSNRPHRLFYYKAPDGDTLYVSQAEDTGNLFAGGTVDGEWQSANGSSGNTRKWRANEWHHVAFTYSAAENFMRFYVDGKLVADTTVGHYWPPSVGGDFYFGGDMQNNVAHYVIDEVRLSGRVSTGEEIAARARRLSQPQAHEIWFATDQLEIGDAVAFEFMPATGAETGVACLSSPLVYSGIPITNPQPPSTLLPPGTTALSLTVQSSENTTCTFSIGAAMPYDEMTPFDQGAGTTVHQTTLSNLDPDPNVVNNIYVRCASHPDYLLQLKYRSLSQTNPSYPRTGKLWGWWDLFGKGLPYMARIDLWLAAADATADEIRELRHLNPDMLILTNINAVDGANLPDDYYLKDIHGNRLEVWPNSYSLNLTKPHVAEYKAHYAYQRMLGSDLMFDGVFFDNVFTTQSWRKYDIYGNRFLVDADEDGIEDDPDTLDAAWKAGVFHELETFRTLMPHAIMSGHALKIYEPGIAEIFNGISMGFRTADVLEGEMIFADLWDEYQAWHKLARQPRVTMIESSPPDQIAYGYDYSPWDKVPPSTLEFARTYYPYVRFGLALTLMNDGYFAHEFGDTWHGNDWWYDELDFELGYPLGPAERVDLGVPPGEDQMVNGGFEAEISDPWRFQVNESEGNIATVTRDTTDKAVGAASARIDVTAASGVEWHIHLSQYNRSLEQGVTYDVSFWAKSDTQRTITLGAQKGSPDWRSYGLRRHVFIDTGWKKYQVSFEANEATSDARILFQVGETSGTVWLDDVRMTVRPPDVYQRKFTNGLVLLNGSQEPQEITVDPGYKRLQGQQAPRYETILDDGEAAFSTTGTWTSVKYDSGELQATGPFYHCWRENCHERSGSQGEARWDLEIQAADIYTITTWWPAAPQADAWNQNVTYEVVVGGQVVASETFDQRSGGDEWHFVAEVPLSPNNMNYVRMYCQGEAPCLADALHLRSRARYNDGSPARKVTLRPLDGIILRRSNGSDVYLPVVLKK